MGASVRLPATTRRAFERLAADSRRVLGDRLVAVVATGGAGGVIFASAFTAGDLDAFSALVEAWHKDGLDTPLLLTPAEFHRSLDTFPLEYQAMIDRHEVIAGAAPFNGAAVSHDQLRRACEVQAKGHLIHLRQGWLEAAGHPDKLVALVANSVAPLEALLTNVARLSGQAATAGEDLAMTGARIAGLPDGLVRAVLAVDEHPETALGLVRDLEAYMGAAETLWAFIDRWPDGR